MTKEQSIEYTSILSEYIWRAVAIGHWNNDSALSTSRDNTAAVILYQFTSED